MKYVFFRLVFSVGAILCFLACTDASTEDLLVPVGAEQITYTENVKPIIDHTCIRCHASPPVNSAPMSLTTYLDVKNAVITRGLLDRIQRNEGTPGAMPLGGPRLPQALIDVIVQWKDDGFPE